MFKAFLSGVREAIDAVWRDTNSCKESGTTTRSTAKNIANVAKKNNKVAGKSTKEMAKDLSQHYKI